ncbi:hypothetical protein [Rhizobium sp. 62_C5_N11_2]|uniref:hypothetical protein n=1 Tax=Rhizobium sp. 62_C5_N11_2 TaxID=3240772 RepID=UPI003F20D2AE
MADNPENQNRREPLIEENHTTFDNLPAEIRMNIMRQAMRGASRPDIEEEAFFTANALRQASPNYRQTLVSNPATLGAKFQQLARATVLGRANVAVQEVGGPGDERMADNVIARRGPFPNSQSDRVRKVGAFRDSIDYGMSGSDAIARHGVTNQQHQTEILNGEAHRRRAQDASRGLDERSRGGRGL